MPDAWLTFAPAAAPISGGVLSQELVSDWHRDA